MKFVAILMFTWIGMAAQANAQSANGERVCAKLNDFILRARCYQIIYTSRIDAQAAGACDRIHSDSLTVQCMDTIKNKSYSSYEVRACENKYDAYETIRCLRYSGNGGGHPSPIPNPGGGTPSPAGDDCYVKQLGRYMSGNDFFSYASRTAQNGRQCVVANIAFQPYSHRIYNTRGERVAKDQGGMSNREVAEVLRRHGMWNCRELSCDRR